MKILVVGSGGREHAIVRKLKESPQVEALLLRPGQRGHQPGRSSASR